MTLELTPLSDAWSVPKKKPKSEKPKEQVQQNRYASPQMQNKILQELGMIESFDEPDYQPVAKPIKTGLTVEFKSKELIDFFRPYSNDYIEQYILTCMQSNNSNYGLTSNTLETIENIYMIVTIIMLLVIIDIALHMKKN